MKKKLLNENILLVNSSKTLSNEITRHDIENNLLLRKKEEQKEIYSKRLRADKIRYDELEINYTKLQSKVKFCQNLDQ